MAKLITPYDFSPASLLINLFGAKTSMAIREFGAVEYDSTLNINSSGSKTISGFDLSSYSQLVNKAGTKPTTTDMRGTAVAGAQREYGALEYDTSLLYNTTPKQVSVWDVAGYSPLVNYTRPSAQKYIPSISDIRGITAPTNAGFTHTASSTVSRPTTVADERGTTAVGSIREYGSLEYDSTLVISTAALSATEISNAVWQTTTTNLASTTNTAGSIVSGLSIRTGTAQAGSSTTITLDSLASAINDFYLDSYIVITGGTGAGQVRRITSYVGSTHVATVFRSWSTNPNSTSVFSIAPFFSVANAVWEDTTANHTTSGTLGKQLGNTLTTAKFLGLK